MRKAHLICGAIGAMLVGSLSSAIAQDAAPQAPAVKSKAAKAKPVAKKPDAATAETAAAVTKDPATATQSYSTGLIAYQAGRYDAAIQSMNAAINNGGLSSTLLAKALYYRGAAFNQQGKSGQAISDLTSSMEFKNGLDDEERADATRQRTAAYAAAGLTQQGQVAVALPATTPLPTGLTGLSPPSSAASPVASFASSAGEPSAPTSGIGSVFGNLFGSSSPQTASAPTTTSAPEVLPWTNRPVTEAAPAAPVPPAGTTPIADQAAQALAAPKAARLKPAKVAAAGSAGSFRIQVASVKSRDEASAIISKLQAAGGVLAASPASVDEATFGAMGTFFRVRLGPYPNTAATKAPCDALKATGLDCLVTAK